MNNYFTIAVIWVGVIVASCFSIDNSWLSIPAFFATLVLTD